MNDRSNRWLGLLLVATLLSGSAVLAAQEDAQPQNATEKKEPERGRTEEKTTAPGTDEETDEPEAAVDPSFNTIEDVLAYRGAVRSLWAARVAPAPVVEWREAGTESSDKR